MNARLKLGMRVVLLSALLAGGVAAFSVPHPSNANAAAERTSELQAADPKQADPADNDKEVITTKAAKRTPATAINFPKELNLPFDSLRTLGPRIEAARRKPDPVALAHMASELSVAEKVSKKTASLTSQTLLHEAAELAAARKQAKELDAMLHVATQLQIAQEDILSTRKQIALAQEIAKADQNYFNSKEEPTNKPRTVVANNYTTQYVDVYINGNYMAQLNPGSSQVFTITQRINPITLKAYGNEDSEIWDPAPIWGRFTKYTWNIQ